VSPGPCDCEQAVSAATRKQTHEVRHRMRIA
jgi:hypothetical protein